MGERLERIKAGGFRRALFLVLAVAALVLCRCWLLQHQAFIQALSPGCYLRRLSGCLCPGCGGTRAFFALLQGEWVASWRMNPLLLSGLALSGIFPLLRGVDWLSKGRLRWSSRWRMTAAMGGWLLGAVIVFGIVRNLPWWPCTLFAPP